MLIDVVVCASWGVVSAGTSVDDVVGLSVCVSEHVAVDGAGVVSVRVLVDDVVLASVVDEVLVPVVLVVVDTELVLVLLFFLDRVLRAFLFLFFAPAGLPPFEFFSAFSQVKH